MPQNFNQGLVAQGPSVNTGRQWAGETQVGALMSRAGQFIEQTGQVLGKARDENAAREFQAASDQIGNTDDYYQKMHEYKSGMANAADDATYGQYVAKLENLTQGREQGVFTPMDAEVRINNLIKEYSQRLPHMSTYFRSAGSMAKGNGTSAMAEMYGTNPLEKVQNEIIIAAAKDGVTPQVWLQRNRIMAQDELNTKHWEALKAQGGIEGTKAYIALDSVVSSRLTVRDDAIRASLKAQLEKKPNTPLDDIKASLSSLKQQDTDAIALEIADFQVKSGVMMPLDQQNQLYGKVDKFYENVSKEMEALETTDLRLKWAETRTKLMGVEAQDGLMSVMKRYGDFSGMVLASDKATFAQLVETATTSAAVFNRLAKAYAGKDGAITDDVWETVYKQYKDQYESNPLMLSMIERHRSGELDAIVAQGMTNILAEGKPPGTGNDLTDIDAKQISKDVYDASAYDKRTQQTVNMVRALDFKELKVSKTLMSDIRGNPEAEATVLEKATTYAIGIVSMPGERDEMAIDFSQPDAPFVYKAWSAAHQPGEYIPNPGYGKAQLEKANGIFRELRDNFGYGIARKWLTSLETGAGIKPVWLQKDLVNPNAGGRGTSILANDPVDPRSRVITPNELRDGSVGAGQFGKRGNPPNTFGTKAPLDGRQPSIPDVAAPPAGEIPDFAPDATSYKLDPEQGKNLVMSIMEHPVQAELSVPKEAQFALFQTESSFGTNLISFSSNGDNGYARGPGQILESNFRAMNAKYFGGELSWDKPFDTGVAAVKFFDTLYLKHKGDLTKTFNEYFTGSPNPDPKATDGGATAESYTAKALRNVEIYREQLNGV